MQGQKTVPAAGFTFQKIAYSQHTVPVAAYGILRAAVKAPEGFGQLGIGPFQQKFRLPVHIVWQEDAKTRLKIVIPGDFIVVAKAL